MAHTIHSDHDHVHGDDCGHVKIRHDDHVDFLHDGHLHSVHGDHVDEHALEADAADAACGSHDCAGHDADHRHAAGCGHDGVPHGDHVDYLVDGHLHNSHDGHCDEHGAVTLA